MGRSPCCDETGLKKGPWTPEEDEKLVDFINQHGLGSWRGLPKRAGLNRCGKSCRLRWTNYLRPDIKRGKFTEQEDQLIINLHSVLGNKWSKIAGHLEGRTDNEIKNYWNTHLRKKLLHKGIDPNTHKPISDPNLLANLSQLLSSSNFGNLVSPSWDNALRSQLDATQLVAKLQLLQSIMQVINTTPLVPNIPPSSLLALGPQNSNISQFEGFSCPTTQVPFSHFTPQVLANPPLPPFGFHPEFDENVDFSSFLNSEAYAEKESVSLPPLASSSSLGSSPVTRHGSENGQEYPSSHPSNSSIFETWEKFLEDDDGDEAYGPWRDILEKL